MKNRLAPALSSNPRLPPPADATPALTLIDGRAAVDLVGIDAMQGEENSVPLPGGETSESDLSLDEDALLDAKAQEKYERKMAKMARKSERRATKLLRFVKFFVHCLSRAFPQCPCPPLHTFILTFSKSVPLFLPPPLFFSSFVTIFTGRITHGRRQERQRRRSSFLSGEGLPPLDLNETDEDQDCEVSRSSVSLD